MSANEQRAVILVVDDAESGRFVKVQTMRRAGFLVHEAGTGQEALDAAARFSPDVIILDVNLPDIHGVEVCRRLREENAGGLAIQILQISSTAITAADRVRGLDHGADVYLIEPVEPEILVATVRALLRTRRAEAALAAALERERAARTAAEDANRLKDEFLATLSHELRTPLNALMGWIWQLRHSTLDENARTRAFDSLERNARVQAQLINDLLDISRISKGKLHLRLQAIELRAAIDGAVESVRELANDKNIAMTVDAEPCVAAVDHARLQQVITNLLMNAVQFTPQNGEIFVTARCEDASAVLRVRDTGSGIEAAFLPYVFDQFRQGEGVLSRKHGGLGLGLAVVRQIVDLHGGTVTASSDGAGHGTTFTVSLPIDPGLQPADTLVLDGWKILVVHAAPHEVADILEACGALTVAASSLVDAAEALERERFDVVLWDRDIPGAPRSVAPLVWIEPALGPAQLVRTVMALHPTRLAR